MCPWHQYRQDWLHFCEEDICSVIRHPSDSYTMIVLLVLSVVIYRKSQAGLRPLRSLAYIGFTMSIGSFIYHATGTFFGQVLDVAAMLLFSSFILLLNVRRLYTIRKKSLIGSFIYLNLFTLLMLVLFPSSGIPMFATELVAIMTLEFLIYRQGTLTYYRHLLWALGCFAIGQIFWHLDLWGIVCWPKNHTLTGHGIWHIASGIGIYFYFKFATQFFDTKENRL